MEPAIITSICLGIILVIREIQKSKCSQIDLDCIGLHLHREVDHENHERDDDEKPPGYSSA